MMELLVKREDCRVLHALEETHPTDRYNNPRCEATAHMFAKEGSFNLPLRVWIGCHNVYQNFSDDMQGWFFAGQRQFVTCCFS